VEYICRVALCFAALGTQPPDALCVLCVCVVYMYVVHVCVHVCVCAHVNVKREHSYMCAYIQIKNFVTVPNLCGCCCMGIKIG